jgi:hypothetical protein
MWHADDGGPGGFDHAVEHVLAKRRGPRYERRPVNFGINQKANPGVDVKNLNREEVIQHLQAPYFDVYIRNPKFAKAALAKSGGDPEKFMDQADSYFQGLAAKPGNQKYAHPYAVARCQEPRDCYRCEATTGGAPPGYHWLTPPKPKDAPSGYRYAADGKTLEPIPWRSRRAGRRDR